MNSGLSSFISLLALKLSSIAVPLYCTLYLFTIADLEQLGHYSSITAVLAPVAMFSAFRYIEYISLSDNKDRALLHALISSLVIFIPLSTVAVLLFAYNTPLQFGHSLWALLLFKGLELSNDILISRLASSNEIRRSAVICISKLALVVTLSVIFYLANIEPLNGLSLALVLGYGVGFIAFDAPTLLRLLKVEAPSRHSMYRYLRDNVRFGVLNLLISLNSVLPRYFFIWSGSFKQLGLFTLLYQLSATAVNILQYVFSIKALALWRFACAHKTLCLSLLSAIAAISITVYFYELMRADPMSSLTPYVFVPLMILAMLSRGFYLTIRVVEKNYPLNKVQINAMLIAVALTFSIFYPSGNFVSEAPYFYVSLSSLAAAFLAARRHKDF